MVKGVRSSFDFGGLAACLALLGSSVSICLGAAFAKRLFPLVGAEGATTLRLGFAAMILLVLWRPWPVGWSRSDRVCVAKYGAALGLMNLCFYCALKTLPLGVAIAIEFLGPLAIAISASRRPRDVVMVGLAVTGLLLLLPIRGSVGALDIGGVCYALLAAGFWALYIVFGKQAGRLHGGHAVALGMATAALVVAPIGVVAAGTALFRPQVLAVGFVVAILSSAIPYSLEMAALKRLPPRSFSILLGLEPTIGALAGVVVLRERLPPLQWLAIGLVVLASIMTVSTDPSADKARLPKSA